jgi:hypothetical protein
MTATLSASILDDLMLPVIQEIRGSVGRSGRSKILFSGATGPEASKGALHVDRTGTSR